MFCVDLGRCVRVFPLYDMVHEMEIVTGFNHCLQMPIVGWYCFKMYLYKTKKNNIYIQWGKKVFSQPPIVQVLPLKKMREACNFHHRYTSTMRDKIRKNSYRTVTVRTSLFGTWGFAMNTCTNTRGNTTLFDNRQQDNRPNAMSYALEKKSPLRKIKVWFHLKTLGRNILLKFSRMYIIGLFLRNNHTICLQCFN